MMASFSRQLARGAIVLAAAVAIPRPLPAAEQPRLHTHQDYIDEVTRTTALDIDDPLAVFAFVLGSLPGRVKVYPTEGYFYFSFLHDGVPYEGNIRLDASDRDEGKVNFAYFEEMAGARRMTPGHHVVLDDSNSVILTKVEQLIYRISFRGKEVTFELNDLSQVKPPEAAVAPDETFIGPVFDESGIRFFLLYNKAVKSFLYVLDETVKVAEGLEQSKRKERMLVGKRTGFIYYRDHRRDRKILIGVYGYSADSNTYFDGPFDQLPDSFIKGDVLRDAILEVDPGLKGKIDRFGGSPDGSIRYMIAPYMEYGIEDDLDPIDRCATGRKQASLTRYYRCFDAVNLLSPGAGEPTPARQGPAKRKK